MKAVLEGNAYKYWSYGGDDVKLHAYNYDDHADQHLLADPDAQEVGPNDICCDNTYAAQALNILKCCGTGSVELHFFTEEISYDYDYLHRIRPARCDLFFEECGDDCAMATYIPDSRIDPMDFARLMFELYDVEAFEYWDDRLDSETRTYESVNTGYVVRIEEFAA